MAKIVVLAGEDDADAVKTALDGASVDYEIVDPTAANLLHIVIGMVDDEAKDDKDEVDDAEAGEVGGAGGKPKGDKAPKEPKPEPADIAPEDDSDIASDASAVPEALGTVKIDGETLKAYAGKGTQSVLRSPALVAGARTTYSINESQFSFWPADPAKPSQRIIVERGTHRSSVEVAVAATKGKEAYLVVGTDIADLFKTK